jgi:DNA-binding transcriptional MocR family regulator
VLQELVAAIWRDPGTTALLAEASATYTERRQALLDALASHGLRAHGRSGLNVWVPLPEEAAMVQFLLGRGWGVRGGERYRFRSAPAIRVTTSDLLPDESQRLAADIAEMARGSLRTGTA